MVDGFNGRSLTLNPDFGWIVEVAVGDLLNHRRHGGRKQGGLSGFWRVLENPFHILNEAHAEHFIRFIEDQCLKMIEIEGFSAKMVHDAPWGADNHMDAASQLTKLLTHPLAAVNRQDMKSLDVPGIGLEGLGDLDGQFAGWRQDQGLGHPL